MLQLGPNDTQQKNWQQNWSSTFSEQAWTKGQMDIAKQESTGNGPSQIINKMCID